MPRNGKVSPPPIIFSAGQVRRGKTQRSEMITRAQAQFDAEREGFVRTVADRFIKQRLAAQLGVRHALQRRALVEWSMEVERRLTLLKIGRSTRSKTMSAPPLQDQVAGDPVS
jgi:hypothetical protein